MKRKTLYHLCTLLLALCLLAGLLPPQRALAVTAPGLTESSNAYQQNYLGNHANITKSFLYPNSIGGLTRVEFISQYGYLIDGKVIVEDYDNLFRCHASRAITRELFSINGFYAGENYNFIIFADQNADEDNDKEVLRVVKYSKDWRRLDSASLYGINTTNISYYSLRCAEADGCLYVHTAHTMYRSGDGLRHQSNLSFCVRESDMTITSGFYRPVSNTGYVSHSFNQFILVDHEQNLVTLDHGDAYPRAVTLFRYSGKAGLEKLIGGGGTRKNLQSYPGDTGDNYTGVELGGFGETANGYVAAYNYNGWDKRADHDMYLAFVDKDLGDVKTSKISGGFDTSTPQLAPTGLDGGYIMWNGRIPGGLYDYDTNLYYAHYDANGNVGPVQLATARLSNCTPIYWNGKVVWYTTFGSTPVFYTLDGSGLNVYAATIAPGADLSASIAYANTQTVLLDGRSVEFQTYALKDSSGLTNYIKLRDMAFLLNGTRAQFSVDWNAVEGISLTTGMPYIPNGSELTTPFSGNRAYRGGLPTIKVNSETILLTSIVLTSDSGGDYTYYKLRDLGKALGFNVSYINGQVVVNTNEPYSDAQ